ncbi:MAG: type II toxin-antitoxin system VapC family toxin [Phenylobacterium sp.]|uniref:type II toxin-antitoxin system VapC family toxin n=1 Tax=Phenylobacterium sp. TaxID=1871053 RepID=UPI00391D939E
MNPNEVLLDTCAAIWLANGDPLAPGVNAVLMHAALANGVFVSPVSAWEIGLLSRPRNGGPPQLQFLPDAKTWFARLMAAPGVREAPFTAAAAIDSAHLPGELHGDPADRLLIATARHMGAPIVTRDQKIIAYGQAGHVAVIPC